MDYLYGEDGNDGLFGGVGDGADVLNGGPGADRFLMPAAPVILPFIGDTGGYTDEDTIQDLLAPEDARPTFLNGTRMTYVNSPTNSWVVDAKNWTEADIQRTDAVLDVLHREARGTKLLETSDQGTMIIVRHGGTNRGFNIGGRIHMTDATMQYGDTTAGDVKLRGYVLHEIAHYWQGGAFQSAAYGYWADFIRLSGWTSTNPMSTAYTLSTNEGRGDRWYLSTATFAIDLCLEAGVEDRELAAIIRDVVRTPAPVAVPDPGWLTHAVTGLALSVYEERAFDRLLVLADALEDAGCADPDVLAHCRGGRHGRGCWVIDLLLGYE